MEEKKLPTTSALLAEIVKPDVKIDVIVDFENKIIASPSFLGSPNYTYEELGIRPFLVWKALEQDDTYVTRGFLKIIDNVPTLTP